VNLRLIASSGLAWGLLAISAGTSATEPSTESSAALIHHGKVLFLRCASCHEIQPSGVKRIGPSLQGVVGRKAGSLADYPYSPAMKAADLVWDKVTLDRWLERPGDVVPGTAMAFGGLPNAADRQAVIAYLENPDG